MKFIIKAIVENSITQRPNFHLDEVDNLKDNVMKNLNTSLKLPKDILNGLKDIDDETMDLSIADPPYFKVVNEKWDRTWTTYEEYLNWNMDWMAENYKKLRVGGTFYLFGYFRNVAELISPLRKLGYALRQQIIVDKGMKSVSGRATKNYKIFPNTTESVFMFIKDPIPYSRKILFFRACTSA